MSIWNSAAQAQSTIDGGATENVPGTQASPWTIGGTGLLTIGDAGSGTLNIAATGVVNSDTAILGAQASGHGIVTVGGANATWNSTGTISVGSFGVGDLTIFSGGAINAVNGVVGGANSGSVLVSGNGSIWNNSVAVTIGSTATGTGMVTVADRGAVTATSTTIGNQAHSTGTLNVNDAGSTWDSTNMTIGLSGTGTLNVSNGGAVTAANASIGVSSGSSGTVTVTGTGSSWIVTDNFTVGDAGQGRLSVLNGATVTSGTFSSRIGVSNGSDGTVTVSGTGSIWNANQLHIGGIGDFAINGDGGSGTLNITSGGRVNSTSASVADGNGATGAVSVSGAGSLWSNTGDLSIGLGGGSASGFVSGGGLAISSGGQVTTTGDAYVGQSSEGSGQVTVSGAGSSFTTGGGLRIGDQGNGFFTVGDGATVTVGGGTGTVFLGTAPTGNGVLSIGGGFGDTAAAVGSLQAGLIDFGTGSGILYFNHTSTNYVFAPEINGGGTIINAAGSTTLSANSNGFTGIANVTGGTLSVNGFFGVGDFNVATGATLGGTGTVGNTTIASGGTLAPGNSIGTLTVAGNLTFNTGSIYAVEVSPSAADRVDVTGAAALAGTVNASFASGAYVAKRYTILNALGGRTGTFGGPVNTNLPSGFTSSLSYDANNAYLDLSLIVTFASLNVNQQNVSATLTNFFNTTGGIPLVFGTLTPAGLTQVSGEAATGSTQPSFDAANQFMNAMLDPSIISRGGLSGGTAGDQALGYATQARDPKASEAYAAVTPRETFRNRWSVWATGYGGNSTVSGNTATGSQSTSSRVYGTAVGADYRLSPDTLLGFAAGGAGFNYGLEGGLGGGRADIFQLGLFGRHSFGSAYVAAALAYGWQNVTTDRTVTVSGADRLHAGFNANTFSARGEGGYRFTTRFAGLTPYAALQATSFMLPGYSETVTSGSNQFALSYASQTTTNVRSELGLRTDKSFTMSDGLLTLRTRAAWAHDSNTDRPATAVFQTLPGATFTVNGAKPAADSALLTAGAEMKWRNGISIGGSFDSELSKTTQSYAGKGTVRYAW